MTSSNLKNLKNASLKTSNTTQNSHDNAFDILRLFFSLNVVLWHSFPTAGLEEKGIFLDFDNKNFISYGVLSVLAFFLISGYLITASWVRSKSLSDFLVKRFLRIYPGLWACFVISAFVFGYIFFFINTGKNYWEFLVTHARSNLHYIEGNLTGFVKHNTINDFVTNSGRRDAFNASIWTIIFEIRAYLFVAILGMLGLIAKRYLILLLTFLLYIFYIATAYNPPIASLVYFWVGNGTAPSLYSYFFVGACFYLFADKIKYNIYGFLFCLIGMIISINLNLFPFVGPIVFGYLIFFLAFKFPLKNSMKRCGDPSYGIYIYSWPIQNVLFMAGFYGKFGIVWHIVASLLLSIIAGFASWHFVEKFFLRKNLTRLDPQSKSV